jgi:hypothetical protein
MIKGKCRWCYHDEYKDNYCVDCYTRWIKPNEKVTPKMVEKKKVQELSESKKNELQSYMPKLF